MVLKRNRRSVTGVGLFLMTSLMILTQDGKRQPRRTHEYAIFWKHSSPSEGRLYPGKYLPFLVFPVEHERLLSNHLLEETLALTTREHRVTLLQHTATTPGMAPQNYTHRAAPPSPFSMFRPGNVWTPWQPKLSTLGDYFKYLHTPQASCRKLVRMGGTPTCEKNLMDGHKYLCLDPPLGLPASRHPQHCLTLSFGVQLDTSFDDAVSDLPCEVHLFDVMDYNPPVVKDREHMHFHTVGLAESDRMTFYNNINVTVKVDTLRNHVKKNGLQGRLIHVLKVDIENSEWDAFKDIANDPLFDAVGQLAMEVHQTELITGPMKHSPPTVPREKWFDALQSRYDVLRMIEARGFRRVLYWDNVQDDFPLVDDHGVRYETSGELLYINTNWFDAAFRRRLRRRGFVQ